MGGGQGVTKGQRYWPHGYAIRWPELEPPMRSAHVKVFGCPCQHSFFGEAGLTAPAEGLLLAPRRNKQLGAVDL